jgi:hypothetical protein
LSPGKRNSFGSRTACDRPFMKSVVVISHIYQILRKCPSPRPASAISSRANPTPHPSALGNQPAAP